MIAAKVSDFTDSIYVNFAREHGAALMGKKIICLIIVIGIIFKEELICERIL